MAVFAGTSVAKKTSELNLELFNAAESGDLAKVKLLTEKGANVNAVDLEGSTALDIEGGTALMTASGMGHLDIVKFLVEKGAAVNARTTGDVDGGAALMMASGMGHLDIVRFLVEKGADINARTTGDVEGDTALMMASGTGHLDIVQFLVEKGADVNAVATGDVEGGSATALMMAAQGGHLDIVKFLIEIGADVNAADKEGRTAQYYATRSVKTEVSDYTETLLKYNPFTCKSYKSTFTYFTQAENTTHTDPQLSAAKGLLKKEKSGVNDIGTYQETREAPAKHLETTIDLALDENKLVLGYGIDPQSEPISAQIPLYQQIFTEDMANTHAYIIFPKEWKLSAEHQEIKSIQNSSGSLQSFMACSPEDAVLSSLLRNYNAVVGGEYELITSNKPRSNKAVDITTVNPGKTAAAVSSVDNNSGSYGDKKGTTEQLEEKYKDYQIHKIPFYVPDGITQAYSHIGRSHTIYFDKSSLTGNSKIFIEIPQITFEQTASGVTRKASLEGLAYELDLSEVKGNYKPERRFVEKSTGLQKKIIDLGSGVTMEFVYIPSGEFMMGSPLDEKRRDSDEGPQHRVNISEGFWMGVYEVTNAQYQQFVKESNYNGRRESNANYLRHILLENRMPEGGSDYPVRWVSWNNACALCEWLSVKQGKTYRLPTEAQWEYACRAGTTTPLNIEDHGLFLKSSGGRASSIRGTHPVGQNKPNSFGLHDMFDNVKEWCQDWYGSYSDTAEVDPKGPSSGDDRVVRGDYSGDIISYRCANRFRRPPDNPDFKIGFRVVCVDSE